jgi:hypothetical protein
LSNYKLNYTGDEINTKLGYVTQDMAIGASPTLTGLTLSGLTANRLIYTNGSKVFTSAFTTDGNYIYSTGLKVGRDADNYIDWTVDNQLTIRCNATNYTFTPTTLSYLDGINQELTTTSSLIFNSMTLTRSAQNTLLVESTGSHANLSLTAEDGFMSRIYFADDSDGDIGQIYYNHLENSMNFKINNSDAITIDSSQKTTFANAVVVQKDQNAGTLIGVRNDSDTTGSIAGFYASFGGTANSIRMYQTSDSYTADGLRVAEAGLIYSNNNSNGMRIYTYDFTDLTLGTANAARLTINSSGNIGVGTISFETSQVGGMCIKQGTDPTTQTADQISIFATAGANCTLGIGTEQAITSESPTADRTLTVKINGALYKLCLEYVSGE